jgi:predicted flap endonuclease-1-like 5' DNA nuclease
MAEMIEANWILLVIALVIGILIALWLFVRSRRTRVEIEPADEGAEEKRIRRNQALIDAPPAALRSEPGVPAARADDPARSPMDVASLGLARGSEAVQAGQEQPGLAEQAPLPAALEQADADTPVAAEDVPVPSPTQKLPTPEPTAAATGDDLTRIKGLGPKIQLRLNELGVTSFAQIAAWDDTEIERIDEQLDRFRGRIRRDNWVEQARLLSAGDIAGYEDRFGKL